MLKNTRPILLCPDFRGFLLLYTSIHLKVLTVQPLRMAEPKLKPLTWRVERIPKGTTATQLKKNLFYVEDQEDITVKSLYPSVESVEGEEEKHLTATVFFRPRVPRPNGPRVQDRRIGVDEDFTGFTPLYVPKVGTGIAAEYEPQNN